MNTHCVCDPLSTTQLALRRFDTYWDKLVRLEEIYDEVPTKRAELVELRAAKKLDQKKIDELESELADLVLLETKIES